MLNKKLERIHKIFAYAYLGFAAIGFLLGIQSARIGEYGLGTVIVLTMLPIGLFHWFAAKGVSQGKRWGRSMSRGIACLWLLGVPIGTILGIYTFKQTGDSWEVEQN